MAKSDTISIDTNGLKSGLQQFNSKKKTFNSQAYATYKSSYLNTSSNTTVTKLKRKVNSLYNELKSAYSEINNYTQEYLESMQNLEQSLKDGKLSGKEEASVIERINKLNAILDGEDPSELEINPKKENNEMGWFEKWATNGTGWKGSTTRIDSEKYEAYNKGQTISYKDENGKTIKIKGLTKEEQLKITTAAMTNNIQYYNMALKSDKKLKDKVTKMYVAEYAKAPHTMAFMEGSNFLPLSLEKMAGIKYNSKQSKTVKNAKNSKKYILGYAAGAMFSFLVGGGASGEKALATGGLKILSSKTGKIASKKVVKFSINRGADVLSSSPINIADSIKQATDESGKINWKKASKYMALNTGGDIAFGGIFELGGMGLKKIGKTVKASNPSGGINAIKSIANLEKEININGRSIRIKSKPGVVKFSGNLKDVKDSPVKINQSEIVDKSEFKKLRRNIIIENEGKKPKDQKIVPEYSETKVELEKQFNEKLRDMSDIERKKYFLKNNLYKMIYNNDVIKAKKELEKINTKIVELYEDAKNSAGKKIEFFKGFEEHNFVHVSRVAHETVATSKVLNELIDKGIIKGCEKVDENTLFFSGLAHDLGMSNGGYKLIDDKLYSISQLEGNLGEMVRKEHPFNSAIIVLQNKEIFGENSEFISCLALIHSKSNSGVGEVNSAKNLSELVRKLYRGEKKVKDVNGNVVYEFDISKIVEVDENGKPLYQDAEKKIFKFKPGVQEQLKTAAICLRVGDAHARKTGFNHGGSQLKILSRTTSNEDNKDFLVYTEDLKGERFFFSENDKGNLFSKQIILGERNTYNLPTTIEIDANGEKYLTFNHYVKSSDCPKLTWKKGIAEKFGEYRSFATTEGLKMRVNVILPKNMPSKIIDDYKEMAEEFSIASIEDNKKTPHLYNHLIEKYGKDLNKYWLDIKIKED